MAIFRLSLFRASYQLGFNDVSKKFHVVTASSKLTLKDFGEIKN